MGINIKKVGKSFKFKRNVEDVQLTQDMLEQIEKNDSKITIGEVSENVDIEKNYKGLIVKTKFIWVITIIVGLLTSLLTLIFNPDILKIIIEFIKK